MNVVSSSAKSKAEIDAMAVRLLGDVLYVSPESVDLDTGFIDLGLDSILAIEYIAELKNELGVEISLSELYELDAPRTLLAQLREKDSDDQR